MVHPESCLPGDKNNLCYQFSALQQPTMFNHVSLTLVHPHCDTCDDYVRMTKASFCRYGALASVVKQRLAPESNGTSLQRLTELLCSPALISCACQDRNDVKYFSGANVPSPLPVRAFFTFFTRLHSYIEFVNVGLLQVRGSCQVLHAKPLMDHCQPIAVAKELSYRLGTVIVDECIRVL